METISTTIWDGILGEWENQSENGPLSDFDMSHESWLGAGVSPFVNHVNENHETQTFARASYPQHVHTHAEAQTPTLTYGDLPPYLMDASGIGVSKDSLEGTKTTQMKSKRGNRSTESASDRRRAQVRLAQQAYRQRKEATVALLEQQVRDLRCSLEEVHGTFENLRGFLNGRDCFRKDAELSNRLDYTTEQIRGAIAKVSRNGKEEISTKIPAKSTAFTDLREPLSGAKPNTLAVAVKAGVPDSLNATSTSANLRANPQILSSSEQKPNPDLPFSAQLRNAALRQGYNLISSKLTPCLLLCKGFRFCIFTSTRDAITRHMRDLLQASGAHVTEGASDEYVQAIERPVPKPLAPSVSTKISEDREPCTTGGAGEPNTHLQDDSAEYIDSEAVQRYLIGKGIDIQPGVDSATVQNPSSGREDEKTLFGELFGDRTVTLSTSKLLYELLQKAVCLSFGPGFRPKDIDEAIRSTMLAAV
ncbi:hypothetical protein DL98DRAFT_620170 [Cadophora sp. DSE1049]|nr:hypothetical protein DL98DRAFT_620170 [Cadophora sp. DSE1049]